MRLINLGEKIKSLGLRNIDMANVNDVSEKAVSEWVTGKAFPNDKSLNYLLGLFGELKAETDSGNVITLRSISNPPSPRRRKPGKDLQKKTA